MYYNVTYRVSDDIYSSNLVIAESEADIIAHYASKSGVRSSEDILITETNERAVQDAQERGKPIVNVQHVEPAEPETTEPTPAELEKAEHMLLKNCHFIFM